MFSVLCFSNSHNEAAKGTFIFHDDLLSFSFQKWIRSMNTDALIFLHSKVHLLYGTKGTWLERIFGVFVAFTIAGDCSNERHKIFHQTIVSKLTNQITTMLGKPPFWGTWSYAIHQLDYDNFFWCAPGGQSSFLIFDPDTLCDVDVYNSVLYHFSILDIMVSNMETTKLPWSNQAQLGLGNLCVKVNTRSWYWNRPRFVNSLLDRNVRIVSLDGKLVPWCYSVTKQHPRLLKQVLTREFSFVKLNWTCVTRFHLELSCGTHSSIFRGSIFWTDIRYVHRSYK